jgi:hypothetical protein
MFGKILGVKCPRCGARNDKGAESCEACDAVLGIARPTVLENNRWEAAPDELAVFFTARKLDGIFSKTLRVPAEMRAWVLQKNRVEEFQAGEYTTENFFSRLNNFFRTEHAEILVSRTTALPVSFRFDDVATAEGLKLGVETTAFVKIGNLAHFRSQFMGQPGVVTAKLLHDMLEASVSQIVREALGGRKVKELLGEAGLRKALSDRLALELHLRFESMGLAFDQVDSLDLSHPEYADILNKEGGLWLLKEGERVKLEEAQTLNDIYDQAELEKIARDEIEMRHRLSRGELKLEEVNAVASMRLREAEALGKMAEAATLEEAQRIEAEEKLNILRGDVADRARQRQKQFAGRELSDEEELQRARELARLRHQAAVEALKAQQIKAGQFASLQAEIELSKARAAADAEKAALIEDAEVRKSNQAAVEARQAFAAEQERKLAVERNEFQVQEIRVQADALRRRHEREQLWEDKQLEDRVEKAKQATWASGLNNAVDAMSRYQAQQLEQVLKAETIKHERELEKEDKAWAREKEKRELEHAQKLASTEDDVRIMREMNTIKDASTLLAVIKDPQTRKDLLTKLAMDKQLESGDANQAMIIGAMVSGDLMEALKERGASMPLSTVQIQQTADISKLIQEAMASVAEIVRDGAAQALGESQKATHYVMTMAESNQKALVDVSKHGMSEMTAATTGVASGVASRAASAETPAHSAGDPVERLRQIKAMLDQGLITQEEYDRKKADVLHKV